VVFTGIIEVVGVEQVGAAAVVENYGERLLQGRC
jgi:hypothetical protein